MTITRLAFFKLLGALGLGQEIVWRGPEIPQCLAQVPGSSELKWTKCVASCEKDEEKCPFGHCQKPVKVNLLTEPPNMDIHIPAKVCSVCGVMYVPKEIKP